MLRYHTLYTNLALPSSEAKRGLAKTDCVCAEQVFGSLPITSVPRKAATEHVQYWY